MVALAGYVVEVEHVSRRAVPQHANHELAALFRVVCRVWQWLKGHANQIRSIRKTFQVLVTRRGLAGLAPQVHFNAQQLDEKQILNGFILAVIHGLLPCRRTRSAACSGKNMLAAD